MTKDKTIESNRAALAASIERALELADVLNQPRTAILLDQALNMALSYERENRA